MRKFKKPSSELTNIFFDAGIENFSIIKAQSFEYLTDCLLSIKDDLPYLARDIQKRINPFLTMPDLKSIICILVPFSADNAKCEQPAKDLRCWGKIFSGDISFGKDYHDVVTECLDLIILKLREKYGGSYLPFCDTGPLVDKELAVISGLCKYGRNSLAINDKLGSHFYIGYIVTNIELEKSTSVDVKNKLFEHCASCDKCIRACPNGALEADKPFNYSKCRTLITQKKGDLTDDEKKLIGSSIYGCSICQDVCPANSSKPKIPFSYVSFDSVLGLSNRQFKEKFKITAAGWIGKAVFIRNMMIANENSGEKRQ